MSGEPELKTLSEWIEKWDTEDHGPAGHLCRVCEDPVLMLSRCCSSKCFDAFNPIVDES